MRRVFAVVALSFVLGCVDYEPVLVSCAGTPTGNSIVCTGDVTITTSKEFDAFVDRGCTSVSGTLTISGTDLTSVCLPDLALVGALNIKGNAALETVRLPVLATVVTSRQCPKPPPGFPLNVETCNGGLAIGNNGVLAGVSLPALATGDVEIYGNALTSVSLPALLTSGLLRISANSVLASVSLPELTSNTLLLSIEDNPALASLSLPALASADSLVIRSNPALTSLSLPALTSVRWWFRVIDNAAYPQCRAEAILAQLTNVPANVAIFGNDPVCR